MSEAVHIKAPWTPEQVDALQLFQTSGVMHPFTCPDHSQRSDLVPTVRGWICQFCDYTQDWAHAFMADRQAIERAIATLIAWQRDVPSGLQLVPVTPTAAMLAAPIGGDKHNQPRLESRHDLRPAIWAAMLKAAPKNG